MFQSWTWIKKTRSTSTDSSNAKIRMPSEWSRTTYRPPVVLVSFSHVWILLYLTPSPLFLFGHCFPGGWTNFFCPSLITVLYLPVLTLRTLLTNFWDRGIHWALTYPLGTRAVSCRFISYNVLAQVPTRWNLLTRSEMICMATPELSPLRWGDFQYYKDFGRRIW